MYVTHLLCLILPSLSLTNEPAEVQKARTAFVQYTLVGAELSPGSKPFLLKCPGILRSISVWLKTTVSGASFWVQVPALQLVSCVPLAKLFNLSEPWLRQIGGNSCAYLFEWLWN